jgi:hypothetical protein
MLDSTTRRKEQMTPPMAIREQHRLGVKFLLVDRGTGVCEIVDPKPWKERHDPMPAMAAECFDILQRVQ